MSQAIRVLTSQIAAYLKNRIVLTSYKPGAFHYKAIIYETCTYLINCSNIKQYNDSNFLKIKILLEYQQCYNIVKKLKGSMMTIETQSQELNTENVIMNETTLASGMRYYFLPAALYYGF